ncbi:hypothetical protein [Pollutibacter soli]|uniref:hypothetical protein n=1 Tax=Pollutibacter soli TaxID=3034157 RepID=UPI003013C1A8
MKKTNNSFKAFIATALLTGVLSLGAAAQQTVTPSGNIASEVTVKETSQGTALLDLAVNNKSTSPFLVLVRDEGGSIVFREWAKGNSYKKRFKLDIVESDKFYFEVLQDKKLIDSKTLKVAHHTEELIEVLAVNN